MPSEPANLPPMGHGQRRRAPSHRELARIAATGNTKGASFVTLEETAKTIPLPDGSALVSAWVYVSPTDIEEVRTALEQA